MDNLQITQTPVSKTAMLIRKPVSEVFEAFIDPIITTKFWFTKSSGRLEPGKTIRWEWEMYGASTEASVKAVDPHRYILIEWPSYGGVTAVEWVFTERPDHTTFVSITESGFRGTGDEVVSNALGSTAGFTMVLAGCKALLEHGIELNLVADRFPEGIQSAS